MFKELLGTLACCGLLSAMAGHVRAGTIMAAEFAGQPLIYQKEGRVNGCGIRVLALSKYSSPRDLVRVVDASFSVYASGKRVECLNAANGQAQVRPTVRAPLSAYAPPVPPGSTSATHVDADRKLTI